MQDLDGFSDYDISDELASAMGDSVMSARNGLSRRPGLPPMPSRSSSKQGHQQFKHVSVQDSSGALSEHSGAVSDRAPSASAAMLRTGSTAAGDGSTQVGGSEPLSEPRADRTGSLKEEGHAASASCVIMCSHITLTSVVLVNVPFGFMHDGAQRSCGS
jgi:hypothetical protein